MQWFDEFDVDDRRYFNKIKYETEEECQDLCDQVITDLLELDKTIEELVEEGVSPKGIRKYWEKIKRKDGEDNSEEENDD